MIFSGPVQRNAIRIEGEKSSSLDLARGRLVMISACFVFVYLLLAIRAFDLSIIQGELARAFNANDRAEVISEADHVQEEDESFSNQADASDVQPSDKRKKVAGSILRGDIYDRNGVLLATTLKTASLYADTKLISDPEASAQVLTKIFPDLSYGDTLQKLQSGKRFVWVRRKITPHEQQAVLAIGEPGLAFEYEQNRIYPQGASTAHLVGYTNVDGGGLAGVERGFGNMLAQGKPLNLSVDMRLQHAVRREVKRAVQDFSAKAGVGIVLDPNTGEVLAGVSWPDFDPHKAGAANDQGMFNRMTLGVYELGSVFKIFSTAALFELKNVPMGTTFDAREPIKKGRFTINDYHAQKRILTIPEVFMHSSNIGSAMMGEAVGNEGLRNFYSDLGLLKPLEFELREVGRPLVPSPWTDIHTLTASYGHGLATTPLQLVSGVASIVNGGYLVKPTLIKSESDGFASLDSVEESMHSVSADVRSRIQIVSPETSEKMRALLRLVVAEGTGKNADVPGYLVGGKTGTAEKSGGKRGYDKKRLVSSFVGAFPVTDPKYVIFVAIDEPQGTKESYGYATGGWVAAPAVKRIASSIISLENIKPYISPNAGLQSVSTHRGTTDPALSLKKYVSEKH